MCDCPLKDMPPEVAAFFIQKLKNEMAFAATHPQKTYAVACDGYIKVGKARHISRRMVNLAAADDLTMRPAALGDGKLDLVLIGTCDKDVEAYLHNVLVDIGAHVLGEWFVDTKEVRDALFEVLERRPEPPTPKVLSPMFTYGPLAEKVSDTLSKSGPMTRTRLADVVGRKGGNGNRQFNAVVDDLLEHGFIEADPSHKYIRLVHRRLFVLAEQAA